MSYSLNTLKQTVRRVLPSARPDARLVTLACLGAGFVLTCVVRAIHGASAQVPAELIDRVKELYRLMDTGKIGFQRMVEEMLPLAKPFGGVLWDCFLFGLIASAVRWTLAYGFDGYCLDLVRGKRPGFMALLYAFPKWGWVLLKGFLTDLFLFGWAVLFGFIGVLGTAALLFFGPDGKLEIFLIALLWVLLAAWLVSIALSYSMSSFILLDDKVDAWEAISRSERMMSGRKRHLFVLWVSFAGWLAPVCALVLLVGRLFGGVPSLAELLAGGLSVRQVVTWVVTLPVLAFLCPYLNSARAKFYDMMRHTDIAYGDWEGQITPAKKSRSKPAEPRAEAPAAAEEAPVPSGSERPDYE